MQKMIDENARIERMFTKIVHICTCRPIVVVSCHLITSIMSARSGPAVIAASLKRRYVKQRDGVAVMLLRGLICHEYSTKSYYFVCNFGFRFFD